jgi:hypothetical protein
MKLESIGNYEMTEELELAPSHTTLYSYIICIYKNIPEHEETISFLYQGCSYKLIHHWGDGTIHYWQRTSIDLRLKLEIELAPPN